MNRDSTETLTEAIGAIEKGRSGSEMRGHKVQYFSEKSVFAEKIQELEMVLQELQQGLQLRV